MMKAKMLHFSHMNNNNVASQIKSISFLFKFSAKGNTSDVSAPSLSIYFKGVCNLEKTTANGNICYKMLHIGN